MNCIAKIGWSSRSTCLLVMGLTVNAMAAEQVQTKQGVVKGSLSTDSKVRIFKGIPYAAPPIGPLRWKAPQPAPKWSGIRPADEFGARCMQGRIYEDMVFRDNGPSEDCLYLNVWTPAESTRTALPVMVWIYGGGFAAGSASEPRQDGENLARKSVVVVSFNYRLGVFGFFSHPELTRESKHHASGNYGLLDQAAALQWVQTNIKAFGGDPAKVTIFGESAGSFSVSALMASPLSKDLFQRAIGESGAFFGNTLRTKALTQSEEADVKFAQSIGAANLEELRSKSAADLLQGALRQKMIRFAPNIDGYFLPEDPASIFKSGKQSHVPLLAGWNHDEGSYKAIFEKDAATAENLKAKARAKFGDRTEDFLKLYPTNNDEEAKRSAQELAGDQFIGFSTWKWIDIHRQTGASQVYRYMFDQAPPSSPSEESHGAYHSAEIEFVFNNLDYKKLSWTPADRKLADLMSTYWTNFAKAGDPNGPQVPNWPVYNSNTGFQVMHLSAEPYASQDQYRARYEFLDSLAQSK
jgi:para-nitrobenzyl esterase